MLSYSMFYIIYLLRPVGIDEGLLLFGLRLLVAQIIRYFIVTPLISHVFSDAECEEANCCTVSKHINIVGPILRTVWQQFWVIISHSAVIAMIGKWLTDIGGSNSEPWVVMPARWPLHYRPQSISQPLIQRSTKEEQTATVLLDLTKLSVQLYYY